MTERDRKKLLLAIDVVLVAAIAGFVAIALAPLGQADVTEADATLRPTSAPASSHIGPLDEYAVIYQRDLARPLYDAPPAVVVTPTVALPIRRTGVMGEPGSYYGMFATSTNETKLAGAGDTVEGVEILEVTGNSATVRFGGKTSKLTKQEEAKP